MHLGCGTPYGDWRPVGFHAFLPLSGQGEAALLNAKFEFWQPALWHIAETNQQPPALYWWASPGTGTSAGAISLIMEKLRTRRYRSLDIYSRPAIAHGARALLNVGFRPVAEGAEAIGSLVIYRRLAFETVRAGIRLCRKKGYRGLYGHAREGLIGFRAGSAPG